MFHFSGCCFIRAMYSHGDEPVLTGTGYPIRKSTGRGLFAAHRGLSQLITSFIACWHQGIHHVLLVALTFDFRNLFHICRHVSSGMFHPLSPMLGLSIVEVAFFITLYADVKEHSIGCCRRTFCSLPGWGRRQNPKSVFEWIKLVWGKLVVGLIGLEPMTLRLSSACSNQLSYRPVGKCSVARIQCLKLKAENCKL